MAKAGGMKRKTLSNVGVCHGNSYKMTGSYHILFTSGLCVARYLAGLKLWELV